MGVLAGSKVGMGTMFRACLQDVTLSDEVTEEELAAKFHFSPQQIRLACRQAAGLSGLDGKTMLDGATLHAACYQQVVHKLGELAHRVPPAYTWEDVVLPAAQKRLMQQACGHIRYRYRVYHQWGFESKISYGRGLSILFAGAPGTGKTMCAQVIARQLNMEMYKINISQVVSKYIGETEKNLQAVFREAKNSNCILFFDECDALFGKRSEVKDSHDRNANVEVAYLLQQIEEYDGVCILATNLIGNIDEAFMRRITYVVHFPFPDAGMREKIYRQMMPQAVPLADDIDWGFLAGKFELSGGYIKNIVLAAAFMAAGEGSPIGMRHLVRAAVGELKKNEIVVVREELQEYADLLQDESV
ncbi:ATP-binding protein [uncultured Agathobaculum sp.]|uniref:ATP-binding protein n=1 Tax=uncultured Agathobaculum sp. TaxID=2048140 RepID=UPI00320B67B4